tara:strand:- start:40 stop:984 length:945 start_codon:yes stop_codon:yes gene_type:complete
MFFEGLLVAVVVTALILIAGLSTGACAASSAEVKRAQRSAYNTDFSTVYGETMLAISKLYPRNVEDAVDGIISTAWYRVAVDSGERNSQTRSNAIAGTRQGTNELGTSASIDSKQYFIRFRVHVVGGKPWRVRVVGEASEIAAGEHPMPLRGAETPPWLKGRTDALRVAIYRKLKKFAVKVDEEIPQAEGVVITIDKPSSFGKIPDGAQELLIEVHRALSLRSFDDLRTLLADDVQWSEGDSGSAEVAMVMWQADTSLMDVMLETIGKGCLAGDGDVSVSCPSAYSKEPDFSGHRLIAEKRGKRWLVTAFVKSE